MKKELLKGLTDEQIKKVEACKNTEEILKLAKEEGIQLNDEQLEAVSGGMCNQQVGNSVKKCPVCQSESITVYDGNGYDRCVCNACHHEWMENKR